MKKCIFVSVITLSVIVGQETVLTGLDIMKKVDAQPEPKSMIVNTDMTLISVKRGKIKERLRRITRHQRNYTSGEFSSKSLLRFLHPADVKGTGFLMWEYEGDQDDDQWLFLPALGKVKRIAAREKSENFMGSDFSYEDISGRELDDDTFEFLGQEDLNGKPYYKVKAVPRDKDSGYSFRISWIDKENWIVKKVEFYDKKERLLKVLDIVEYRKDGPYWSVLEMRMENVRTEHKTIMKMFDIKYDTGIRDNYFTERFLKRVD